MTTNTKITNKMCLITLQQNPLIANEDITVFKRVRHVGHDDIVLSEYEYFGYSFGTLYKTTMQLAKRDIAAFDFEDSSFLNLHFPEWYEQLNARLPIRYDLIAISEGFHAVLRADRLPKEHINRIVVCTIPKGAEYYMGFTSLIVSNEIIINKWLVPR